LNCWDFQAALKHGSMIPVTVVDMPRCWTERVKRSIHRFSITGYCVRKIHIIALWRYFCPQETPDAATFLLCIIMNLNIIFDHQPLTIKLIRLWFRHRPGLKTWVISRSWNNFYGHSHPPCAKVGLSPPYTHNTV